MSDSPNFLTPELARSVRDQFETPVYVYDEASLRRAAVATLAFPNAFGLTVRYAMKANPNAAVLKLFDKIGLHFDASSSYEVERALLAGIPADKISLSAQELPRDLERMAKSGIHFVATSLHQLETWGASFPGTRVALRFNPGVGSGGMHRTNVGGPNASFGIWHEWMDQVLGLCAKYRMKVNRVHTHIGSGSDPEIWKRVAVMSLSLVEQLPDVTILDLGGGFKVARMSTEVSTDLQEIGQPVETAFRDFARRTGREIRLEIEPGTFLLANCGTLLASIQDIVSTGESGHEFIRTDTGMSDILRPAMYGAQHPLVVYPAHASGGAETSLEETAPFQVVGHCCETSDVMTVAPGDPERLASRVLSRPQIGDLLCIEGAGAYCASMCAGNYNSFPLAPEVLIQADGTLRQIRRRQTVNEIVSLEHGRFDTE